MASARDVLVAAFRSLPEEDQRECFHALRLAWAETCSGSQSAAERYLASLARVADEMGGAPPSVEDYKAVARQLRGTLCEIEPFSALYRHYGSWPRALEALGMSDTLSAAAIEARFRIRRVGKVWRFNEQALRDALMRAADHWGHPPTTGEYEFWRNRELQLAASRGEPPCVPSTGPFRTRFGSWEGALLHFGFTPEQVAARLEGKQVLPAHNPDAGLPEGLPIAELANLGDQELPLKTVQARWLIDEWDALPQRSRYVLTVRLGLGGAEELTLRQAAEPLGLSLDRVRQLQLAAVDALCRAASGGSRSGLLAQMRAPVVETLRRLAAQQPLVDAEGEAM